MILRELNGGACKTYLLASETSKEAALVDPVLGSVEAYLALLRSEGYALRWVIDSHTHADHLSGCPALQDKTGAGYLMHRAAAAQCVSRRLEDGEALGLGDVALTALYTPGHTRDSLSLLAGDRLLTGDFLFIGPLAAGRLDLPGADPKVHYESLRKLDGLADSVAVLPAHDYQGRTASTLGEERRLNPVLQPRSRDAYLRWWGERRPGPAEWMGEVVRANMRCNRDPGAVHIPADQAACACSTAPGASASVSAPHLSADELERDIKAFYLLDVRTPEEFNDELGHIAGAKLIPVDELEARVGEVPTQAKVALICRSGKRALRAAGVLQGAGRRDVVVLSGGMLAWNQAGLPIVRD